MPLPAADVDIGVDSSRRWCLLKAADAAKRLALRCLKPDFAESSAAAHARDLVWRIAYIASEMHEKRGGCFVN
ncbi:hypothetical protein GGH95_000204 [Coemansia sp. RSA 1836]|nr:hypothetical protein GGH95_000204 [Coemansia sp. RSA 1836]